MRLLIDTHALLWWLRNERPLSRTARQAIAEAEPPRFFSVAGAWEMAIKCSTGKLKLSVTVGRLLDEHLPLNHAALLGITLNDLIRLESLPRHHRDPFDRMMAAQALERDLTIASADPIFEKYGVKRVW